MRRKGLALIVAGVVFVCGMGSFAEAGEVYSLKSATEEAVKQNSRLRAFKSRIPVLNEQVRRAKAGANQLDQLYKAYKSYESMYNAVDDPWKHLKNLSNRELAQRQMVLNVRIMKIHPLNEKAFEKVHDELTFIAYAQRFGTDDPKLSKKEIYKKYVKTIELTGKGAEKERDKALNNMDIITANVIGGMTKIYLNTLNLEEGIYLQEELLALRKTILKEVEALYQEGIVSKHDRDVNEKQVEILRANIEKMKIQKEGLVFQFNKMIGKDIEYPHNLNSLLGVNSTIMEQPIGKFVEESIKNNPQIKSHALDIKYVKENLRLYKKYEGAEFGAAYDDMIDEIDRLEKKIREQKRKLEQEVKARYAKIVLTSSQWEEKAGAFRMADEKLRHVRLQKKLGLAKKSDVHKAELDRKNKEISFKMAKRRIQEEKVLFNTLVHHGVSVGL